MTTIPTGFQKDRRVSAGCNNLHAGESGFTLAEFMVGMVAASIVILIVSALLIIPLRTMKGNREYARMRREHAFAMQLLNKDIRLTTWGEINDAEVEDNVRDGYLKLDFDSGNILAIRDEEVEYKKINNTLVRSINGGVDVTLISEGLQRFTPEATNDVNGIRGIVLKMQMKGTETDADISKEVFIFVRN